MKDKIYAYSLYADCKYIIAFYSPRCMSKPYTAINGTNNKYKAIWIAFRAHLRDKLEWVVIQNY